MKSEQYYLSPIGWLVVVADQNAILQVRFCQDRGEGSPSSLTQTAIAQLAEYFEGKRREFDLPLSFDAGTAHESEVWKKLVQIAFGQTKSYGELGSPRAVARACAKNPLAIVVPCHRVIRKDGGLAGYNGGITKKQFLLSHETKIN